MGVSKDQLQLPSKFARAIQAIVHGELEEGLSGLRAALESIQQAQSPGQQDPLLWPEIEQQLRDLQAASQRAQRRLQQLRALLSLQLEVAQQRLLRLRGRQRTRALKQIRRVEELARRSETAAAEVNRLTSRFQELGQRFAGTNQNLKDRFRHYQERLNGLAQTISSQFHQPAPPLSRQGLLETLGPLDWTLEKVVALFFRHRADRLCLSPGRGPELQAAGQAFSLKAPCLSAAQLFGLVMLSLEPDQREELAGGRQLSLFKQHGSSSYRQHLFWERGQLSLFLESPSSAQDCPLPAGCQDWLSSHSGLILVCGGTAGGRTALAGTLLTGISCQRRARIIAVEADSASQIPENQSQVLQLQRGRDVLSLADIARLRPDAVLLDPLGQEDRSQVLSWASQGILVIACCPEAGAMDCLKPFLEQHASELALCLRGVIGLQEPDGYQLLPNDQKVGALLARGDLAKLAAILDPETECQEESAEMPIFGWT